MSPCSFPRPPLTYFPLHWHLPIPVNRRRVQINLEQERVKKSIKVVVLKVEIDDSFEQKFPPPEL